MNIREIRRAKNITQKKLAEAIGVNESVISRYEKGIVTPPANKLEKIAAFLEVSVDYLLDINESDNGSVDREKQAISTLIEWDKYATREFAAAKRILEYAKGFCELCGNEAPFCTADGMPYLEAHFVEWLSEGGQPTIDNVVALCPNCHKKIHILHSEEDLEILRKAARNHIAK